MGDLDAGRRGGMEEGRSEVLGRQIQIAARILSIANLGNLASIAMIGGFLVPPGAFRTVWTLAFLLVIAHSCGQWTRWLRNPHRTAGRREQVLLTADVALGGLFYAALEIHVLPQLAGPEQVVLVGTVIGVVGSGAIALSTLRSAGCAWLVVTLGGLAIGFARNGSDVLPIELAHVALYAGALAAAIAYLSWSLEQRCRAERSAERDRDVVALLLDDFEGGARDWLWQTGPSGRIVAPSTRFVERSGLAAADLEQRTVLALVDGRVAGAGDELRRAFQDGAAFREVVVPVQAGGDRRWWSVSGAPRPDGSWRGVGSDVTEGHEQEREIRRLASVDALTGLANRHRFSAELRRRVEGRRAGQDLWLSIVDLDSFKAVNDTLGHPTGDRLLVAVADRLRAAIAPGDLCARLGGDEFAVVCTVGTCAEPGQAAGAVAASLAAAFDQPFAVDGARLEVRASIGQASAPNDAIDAEELVLLADLALYAAKAAGSGAVRAFEPQLRAAAEARSQTQRDLQQAIIDGAIELHFQPLVAPSGQVVAFEALARWHHEVHGWISPATFIPVAEETGLIVPLGDQVLDRALATASSFREEIGIAVNVAPAQLVSAGFAERFQAALDRHGVAPHRVDLEVTESAVVAPDARQTIAELRRIGCGVAVDDFGTGYSSFASLQDLPITQLKIDRAFISRLDRPADARAPAIVQAIVDVARATGMTCVAEGVETEEQRSFVQDLGCIVQGYVEARPMTAAAIPGYLDARRADGPTRAASSVEG